MKSRRLGGWQFWVDLHDLHVIKTPKNKKEIKEKITKFLKWQNKLEELNERTVKMIFDIKNSTKIIKNSKIPRKLLGDLEFLEKGKLKQKKVLILGDLFMKLEEERKLELIDKIIKFLLELWKYGIHEKTFKFFSNFGLDENEIILVDAFELEDNKKKILKQIKKQKWNENEDYKKYLSQKELEYLNKELDKNITEKNLNKYWKIK